MNKPRYPLPRYPTGWFQVGYADEIEVPLCLQPYAITPATLCDHACNPT